jgi:hypothetical protein
MLTIGRTGTRSCGPDCNNATETLVHAPAHQPPGADAPASVRSTGPDARQGGGSPAQPQRDPGAGATARDRPQGQDERESGRCVQFGLLSYAGHVLLEAVWKQSLYKTRP